MFHDAAQLNEIAGGIANVESIEILGYQARVARQLRHHEVLFAAYFDATEIEAAEKDLQGARNSLHRDAQRGGAVAVDVEA